MTGSAFSLSDFNFTGFSSSKGWCGYFERKECFSFDIIERAICLFEDFFKNDLNDFFIMTALSYEEEHGRETDADIADILKMFGSTFDAMKNKGYLQPMTDGFFHYLVDDAPLPTEALRFQFDPADMPSLSQLMMAHDKVIGQICFFINTRLNIALYPHGDTGYGCIGLNGKKEMAIKFLEFCRKDDNFRVVIEN